MRWAVPILPLALGCGFVGFDATSLGGDAAADGDLADAGVPADAADEQRDLGAGFDEAGFDDAGFDDAGFDDAGDGGGAAVDAGAPTFFISPSGSVGAPGTREEPFRTFSEALAALTPGSTLVLLSGRYSASSGTGVMRIDCRPDSTQCAGAPCPSGTAGAPITVIADQERMAQLHAEAGDVDYMGSMRECGHYRIEGLTFIGADIAGNPWHSLNISHSSNVVVRRNLFMGNNRFANSHLLIIGDSSDVLAEENELYNFHRAALSIYLSNNVTARRNYANSRGHADIDGGRDSGFPEAGDAAFSCSHSHGCLYENNVSDGLVDDAFEIGVSLDHADFTGEGDDARFIGNLAIGSQYGVFGASSCGGATDCGDFDERVIDRPTIQNNVFMEQVFTGVLLRGVREALVDHNTFFESRMRIDRFDTNQHLQNSARVTNNSIVDAGSFAIVVAQQSTRFVGFNNTFGPGSDTSFDGGDEGIGVNTNVDPSNGACIHRNDLGSPLIGEGEGGSNIGATIVNRYEDGVLTDTPLWAPDGSFACGAVVPGINDTGPRCTNVHARFNVGTCAIE
ncbi:MAG: right-handed parallel beta-helix repeat-containing protein [Myxococcota bacterium]